MESVILSNDEETMQLYITPEQVKDIVKLKVSGIMCIVTLMEGDTMYTADIKNIHLLQ